MKRIFYLLFTMLCFEGAAQPLSIKERISLSTAKTVSLIFPSHVQSIDRGSDLIIVQKATENIVKVKAVKDSFPETNLTIITADGKLYSLILDFKKDPSILVWNFNDSSSIKTQHPMEVLINRVRQSKNHLPGMKYRSGQVSLQWLGWYINVFLWLPVANIFGAIIGKIQERMFLSSMTHMPGAINVNDAVYLIFMLIAIVGYCTVPSVANYIVNAGGGHALVQKVTSMGSMAVKGISGSMSADSFGNAASRMSNSMSDNGLSNGYFKEKK